ncbi:2-dehydropantoate 2-reductase [Sporosarcina luteola]|nr:2-dehydropantoate 2-reductase [Sporosarcina luteola]
MKLPGKKPRILLYGSGVIGSIFGGKLAVSNVDVTMLARGARFEQIKDHGIILQDVVSGKIERVHVNVINHLDQNDRYDYIMVAVQHTQLADILPILSKNSSPNIVFVVNNPTGYQSYIDAVGYDRVMLGFPSAGGERKDGIVSYMAGRGVIKLFQSTTFGEVNGKKTERLEALIDMFRAAGFSPSINHHMDEWLKTHVAVVLPIAKALYKFDSNNYELANSNTTLRYMILAIREGFNVLKKAGVKITPAKLNLFYLPSVLLVPILSRVMKTKIAEFSMSKHTMEAKHELQVLESLFVQIAKEGGEELPYLLSLGKQG